MYDLVYVSSATFADAIDPFEAYGDQNVTFTDAATVAVCKCHDIE